ncbi:MAG: hypothetical protein ACPGUV_12575, partial [Polyangiales bacterium]
LWWPPWRQAALVCVLALLWLVGMALWRWRRVSTWSARLVVSVLALGAGLAALGLATTAAWTAVLRWQRHPAIVLEDAALHRSAADDSPSLVTLPAGSWVALTARQGAFRRVCPAGHDCGFVRAAQVAAIDGRD